MLEIAFQYDPTQDKWVRCLSKEYVQQEIEKIPCILLLRYMNGEDDRRVKLPEATYVFCRKYHRAERITEIRRNYVNSVDGCHFEGLVSLGTLVLNPHGLPVPEIYVPFRWRIFQKETSGPINIAADVAEVQYDRAGALMHWDTFSVSAHIEKRRMVISELNGRGTKDWTTKTRVEMPEIVTETAMEALRESTKLATGIKPSVLSQMKGTARVIAYIERPFDLNIVFLKSILPGVTGHKFDEVFPYDCKDNYRKICQLLDIHPPKSLRKAYSYNPYAIVWYMIFKHWWIRDINLMQKFFYLDDNVAGFSLKDCYITSDASRHIDWPWNFWHDWRAMNRYCIWRITQEGEKKFLRWLYQVSSTDTLQSWQWDTINAFYHNESRLSDEIKRILLRDGLTQYVHDQISWEVTANSKGLEDVQISYEPHILAYECIINGYEFHVAQDTHTLRHIGLLLQNCVATYRELVISHRSIIVAVRHDAHYVACIELRGEQDIVQALGPRNQRLNGETLLVCRYWAKLKKLHVKTNHLDFPDTSQEICDLETVTVEAFPDQTIVEKNVEETGSADLLTVDENNIQPGYYRQLGMRLLRESKHNIAAPPWMQFQDEKAYLMYVFPQGQRIYDAAFKGNTEAQIVLGMMYCCGRVLRRDTEKTLMWFSKITQNGSIDEGGEMETLKEYINDATVKKDLETLWSLSRIHHMMETEEHSA